MGIALLHTALITSRDIFLILFPLTLSLIKIADKSSFLLPFKSPWHSPYFYSSPA